MMHCITVHKDDPHAQAYQFPNIDKIFSYAKEIASIYEAQLFLQHIIEETPQPFFYVTSKESILKKQPDLIEKTKEKIEDFLKESKGPEVRAEIQARSGHPVWDILKIVGKENIDLIVIATHGLTGLEHFLMGSVAEKVVRRATCPVLSINAFGKSII